VRFPPTAERSKSLSKPNPSDQALQRAALALQMGRPQEAEQIAGSVLKGEPGNVGAAILIGQALLTTNRAADAIAPLQDAARLSGDPRVETLLAAALGACGRSRDALDQLHKTTARRPPFLPAFLEHCGQLQRTGNLDEAIVVAESALGLMPDSVDLQLAMARLLVTRNDRARARAVLSQAQAAAPQRPDVLAELARVMVLDGEYAAAADVYRRALALWPDDAMTRANFASCLLELQDRSGAEAQLRKAVQGRPQMVGRAIATLASASHGRFFMRPSAAAKFLRD
jgi:tetratricopeptide (TPR) repeat protein